MVPLFEVFRFYWYHAFSIRESSCYDSSKYPEGRTYTSLRDVCGRGFAPCIPQRRDRHFCTITKREGRGFTMAIYHFSSIFQSRGFGNLTKTVVCFSSSGFRGRPMVAPPLYNPVIRITKDCPKRQSPLFSIVIIAHPAINNV